MTLDKALKKIKTLKSELKLAKASYYEKCAEFNNIYIDYAKLQVKSKRFESNMKNVLEIEKKNAVEEFAEKLKNVIHERDYVQGYAEIGLIEEIDELLKEYKNDFSKY